VFISVDGINSILTKWSKPTAFHVYFNPGFEFRFYSCPLAKISYNLCNSW